MIRAALCLLAAALLSGCGKSPTAEKSARGGAAPSDVSDDRAETAAAPETAPRTARGATALRFAPAVILDSSGFGQPVAAASLLIPYGWTAEGGVVWGGQFLCTNGYNFDWRATAPDGSSGVAVIPQTRWENNSYGAAPSTPGCASAPYTNVRQYVEGVAAALRPGARVLEFRERPDLLKDAPPPTRVPAAMGEMRTWTEAGEALIGWREGDREMRGLFAARVGFQSATTDMSGMMQNDPSAALGVQPVGPTRFETLAAFAEPGWFAFAPEDRFSPGFFEAIRRTIAANPEWASAIAGHNSRIARVALDESAKRSRMIAATNEEIARIRQETWNARQESAERQFREFGELMKGVETYRDADAPGGQVELDHAYKDAWRLQDGTYVLSNDPLFDPNRDLQIEARRLTPVE